MKLRRRRWIIFIGMLMLTLVVVGVLLKSYFTNQLRLLLERELSRQISGQVTIHHLYFEMARPLVEIEGLKIESAAYGIRDFSLAKATLRLSPLPFFFGRISISEIEVGDTIVQLTYPLPATPRRLRPLNNDINSPGSNWQKILDLLPERFKLLTFEIEKIHMARATLQINEIRNRWQLSFDFLELLSEFKQRTKINFSLSGHGKATFTNEHATQDFVFEELSTTLFNQKDQLVLEKFILSMGGNHLDISGNLLPKIDVKTKLTLLLNSVPRYLEGFMPISPTLKESLQGKIHLDGKVTGNADNPLLQGALSTQELRYADGRLDQLKTNFELSLHRLRIKSLKFPKIPGDFDGNLNWEFNSGDLVSEIQLQNFPTRSFSALLQPIWQSLPDATGDLSGKLTVTGHLAPAVPSSLKIDATLTTPIIKISGSNWQTNLHNFSLTTQTTSKNNLKEWDVAQLKIISQQLNLAAKGFYRNRNYSLEVNGSVENGWQNLHPSLQKLFGRANFTGKLDTTPTNRHADFNLSGTNFRIGSQDGWLLSSHFTIDDQLVSCHELRLQHQNDHLIASGNIDLQSKEFQDIQLSMKNMSAELPISFLPTSNEIRELIRTHVDGTISGSMQLDGPILSPDGEIKLQVSKIRTFGENFDNLGIDSDFSEGNYRLKQLVLKKGDGTFHAKGELNGEKATLQLKLTSDNLNTADFTTLKKFVPKSHPLVITGELSGPLKTPEIDLQLLLLNDKEALITTRLIGLAAHPLAQIRFANNPSWIDVNLNEPYTFKAILENFNPFQLATYLGHRFYQDIDGTFSGNLDLHHQANQKYDGKIQLEKIQVKQSGTTLLQQSSLNMEMLQDKLYLRSCMLEGFSTYFVCKNDQSVEGFVNLSLLRTFFDFFARSEGQAYVKLKSKGSITDFNFDGAVNVTNGILNFKGFPTLMENVQVNALVRGNRIIVNQFNLTAGDGGGSGKGEMLIGNHWDSILFDLLADVKDLPVRVPEDFPANVTGRVTFTGPGSDSKLQGDAKINSLHYTKRFDWRSKLLEFGGKNNRMVNTSLIKTTSNNGHGVNFDLHFTAAEPVVTLKNNITDVAMTSNFSLVGKFPNVALLGTLNVSTGRFEFRNQIFNIDSGTIDFRSLHSYEPSFVDIYASTRVQEYNVNLNIRTVNDAYRVDMTSTPPLSETDLLSLLTVGTVTNSYANFSTQQSGLTQGVAVGIVSGGLQDKLERIGLLDTFQVIPDYSQISKSTQLRLMVGKDLAKDVGLIYSTDLYNAGTNQEMRLKQTVNKNFSLSGTVKNSEPNQNVDLGVDFEFGFDF